jgi:hypothetical protein
MISHVLIKILSTCPSNHVSAVPAVAVGYMLHAHREQKGIRAEASMCPMQLPLLKKRWVYIVFGAVFQYCHGLGTQLAHRMHRPQPQPLHDVGFAILPVRMCRVHARSRGADLDQVPVYLRICTCSVDAQGITLRRRSWG